MDISTGLGLVAAVVLESLSFRTVIHESNQVRGSDSWVGFVRHTKIPELPVVLLEDFAALIGIHIDAELDRHFTDLRRSAEGIHLIGEISDRLRARVMANGELMVVAVFVVLEYLPSMC